MLFSDVTHRNLLAFAVGDRGTEDALAQENAFGMVAKSAMPEISHKSFGLIKPVVDREVVLGLAAEFSGTAFCMLHWVRHGYTS
jgi:hypothetical protein